MRLHHYATGVMRNCLKIPPKTVVLNVFPPSGFKKPLGYAMFANHRAFNGFAFE